MLRKVLLSSFVTCCLVLCLAGAAFCIDPFAVNEGGFGPKIKGLQLGMKLPVSSLYELVVYHVKLYGFPVRFEINSDAKITLYEGEFDVDVLNINKITLFDVTADYSLGEF